MSTTSTSTSLDGASTAQSGGTRFPAAAQPTFPQGARALRYGVTAPGRTEFGSALHSNINNIDNLRRQVELQAMGRWPLRQGLQEAATSAGHPGHSHHLASASQTDAPHIMQAIVNNLHDSSSAPPTATQSSPNTNNSVPMPYELSTGSVFFFNGMRLEEIQRQVGTAEYLLDRGITPLLMDQLDRVKPLLLDLYYRIPLAQHDRGIIRDLLLRIVTLGTRAAQLRVDQVHARINNHILESHSYLLVSPDGYHAVLSSPHKARTAQTMNPQARAPEAHTHLNNDNISNDNNNNDVVFENVVRQGVLNRGPRRRQQARNRGLARSLRTMWMFIRLYLFCCVLSEPDSWTHLCLVALSAFTAIIWETVVPQYLYQSFVVPIQRHLEGLLQFGIDGPLQQTQGATVARPPAPPRSSSSSSRWAQGAREPTTRNSGSLVPLPGELRNNLRRVERSVALFMASLIPGVGERHVEARQAVEAAQNRAAEEEAEEEERRRVQREQEEQSQGQNHEGESVAVNGQ